MMKKNYITPLGVSCLRGNPFHPRGRRHISLPKREDGSLPGRFIRYKNFLIQAGKVDKADSEKYQIDLQKQKKLNVCLKLF